jgi:tight adherence protein B
VNQQTLLLLGLAALYVGGTLVVAAALGVGFRSSGSDARFRRRLSLYTLSGRAAREAQRREPVERSLLGNSAITRSALGVADRVARRRGLDGLIAARLEAASLPIRAPEWMLIHVGIALATAVLLLALTVGNLLAALFGLIVGLVGPWMFLIVREGRREAAFLARLPDTLHLLAGSLKAGHSLPQAIDSVVREAEPPISTEFQRALVESRLGMPVEEALEGIAARMESHDFSWVVMAIRIQREVGGNLAELLLTVSDTLRERERLRRQVKVLSAEGRLSGAILSALPVVFTVFLMVAQPTYLAPMVSTLGLALIGLALVLLLVGVFWMSRVVKVDV